MVPVNLYQNSKASPVTRPKGSNYDFISGTIHANANTAIGEFLGVIDLEAEEAAKDAEWDAYLKREWEERNMEYGFRCDFALKALHMHGPCKVYRPNEEGDLVLVEVLDPVTRKPLDKAV